MILTSLAANQITQCLYYLEGYQVILSSAAVNFYYFLKRSHGIFFIVILCWLFGKEGVHKFFFSTQVAGFSLRTIGLADPVHPLLHC